MNKLYNKNLTTVAQRGRHINEIINQEEYNERLAELVRNGERVEETGIGKHLEQLANYYLESKDIETGRQIDDKYYKSERDFRRYKAGKTALVDDNSKLDYLTTGQDEGETVADEYIDRLMKQLDGKAVQRWISQLHLHLHDMTRQMVIALTSILDAMREVGTEKEIEVFKLFLAGKSANEIAEIRNVSMRNVEKQFKNICEKISDKF